MASPVTPVSASIKGFALFSPEYRDARIGKLAITYPELITRAYNDMETMMGLVLLATADPVLRETRTALLRSFGLETAASKSADHALELIRSRKFDLLVLGSSLSPEECNSISTAFQQQHPYARVVEILPGSAEDCRDNPDATVLGLDGPLALRRVVFEQLRIARQSN